MDIIRWPWPNGQCADELKGIAARISFSLESTSESNWMRMVRYVVVAATIYGCSRRRHKNNNRNNNNQIEPHSPYTKVWNRIRIGHKTATGRYALLAAETASSKLILIVYFIVWHKHTHTHSKGGVTNRMLNFFGYNFLFCFINNRWHSLCLQYINSELFYVLKSWCDRKPILLWSSEYQYVLQWIKIHWNVCKRQHPS